MKKVSSVLSVLFSIALLFVLVGCSSDDDETTPVAYPPNAPAGLTSTQTVRNSVILNWTDTADEDSFHVQRSVDSTAWTQLGQLSANTVTYTDQSAGTNRKVWYKVRGKNVNGNGNFSIPTSIWTWPSVLNFSSDQTNQYSVTYTGTGSPFAWTYDATAQAAKMTVEDPAASEYVNVYTSYTNPNQGWFESSIKIGQWHPGASPSEVGVFVELDPTNASDNVVGVFLSRDSTIFGYRASNSFHRINSNLPPLSDNAFHRIRFLHKALGVSGNIWELYIDNNMVASQDLPNVASNGNLTMEWQFDRGNGPDNQVFWLDDISKEAPPVALSADSPRGRAAKKLK